MKWWCAEVAVEVQSASDHGVLVFGDWAQAERPPVLSNLIIGETKRVGFEDRCRYEGWSRLMILALSLNESKT